MNNMQIFFALVISMTLITGLQADCCKRKSNFGCCGNGPCNIFCCNCDGGCNAQCENTHCNSLDWLKCSGVCTACAASCVVTEGELCIECLGPLYDTCEKCYTVELGDAIPEPEAETTELFLRVGCFTDDCDDRDLPQLLLTDRDPTSDVFTGLFMDWSDYEFYIQGLVCRCADAALANNFKYFGIQFYGECWGGNSFGKHGYNGSSCTNATALPNACNDEPYCVGEANANYIYGIPFSYLEEYANASKDDLKVTKGQVTFDAEGNDDENSMFFSRKPHVPTASSGITIGRGYDMRDKTKAGIIKDLKKAGIDEDTAKKFGDGAGLKGDAAKTFLQDNNLKDFTITHAQQKKLFGIVYDRLAKDVKRICEKADVVAAYGRTNWACLNKKIKEILIDLRFRGDYTPKTRQKIQKAVADNDLKKFTVLMSDKDYWVNQRGVPEDRFKRRKEFLTK